MIDEQCKIRKRNVRSENLKIMQKREYNNGVIKRKDKIGTWQDLVEVEV